MPRGSRPIISFLSDFGLDGAAAICRGVILSLCPDAQIVDISHTVRKFAIGDGAFILSSSLPFMPVGVHMAVVDPGVGTDRRPIALRVARGDVLVGPDNGLLIVPAESLGGIEEARLLDNRELWLPITASTFHGRDVFAPVTGHLAAGSARFDQVGPAVAIDELVTLPQPGAEAGEGWLATTVIYVDSFGNLRLAGGASELAEAFGDLASLDTVHVEIINGDDGPARTAEVRFAQTFGAVPLGSALLYLDSSGHLALADNQGSAATRLRINTGQRLRIRSG